MNEIDSLFLRERHDAINVEIRRDRAVVLAHEIRFVCLEAMHAQAVLLRIHRHGAQPRLRGRAKNADGNLAAIRREEFVELLGSCA